MTLKGVSGMHGGLLIARVLQSRGIKFLFTLCGGHISPILVACKTVGIRVIDTRHEATAVFAADAVARLTGNPGVAAVTAGPGVTNTITAIKNAQLAQSPLLLLGGAAATILKGRGALQDIDQMALFTPHVKWAVSVKKVRNIIPTLEKAFEIARSKVPGPVFVEFPVDLLYEEQIVRQWYMGKALESSSRSLRDRAFRWYMRRHLNHIFRGAQETHVSKPKSVKIPFHSQQQVKKVATFLKHATRPVMLIGSQALLLPAEVHSLAAALKSVGVPVFTSGMARGLLGREHPLLMRHTRKNALKEADLVILAGVSCDFRLDYGRHIHPGALHISINRSRKDLTKNKRPTMGILADPGEFLKALAEHLDHPCQRWDEWRRRLKAQDQKRELEITHLAKEPGEKINPLHLCLEIDAVLDDHSIIVVDGGDFVATASYIIKPRSPLSWLDPGPFGTLGVGAGFALGAKLCFPDKEVWLIYGDGAAGFSLPEFDTFVRHEVPILAVVGNDASWAQIAREQVELLKDDVGTVLRHNDYHIVAEGFGGKGELLKDYGNIQQTLTAAKSVTQKGTPFLINAIIRKTEFRKGSISM